MLGSLHQGSGDCEMQVLRPRDGIMEKLQATVEKTEGEDGEGGYGNGQAVCQEEGS